ncbi:hypothetical protein BBP40_006680 [Aspergillus hancockii]|nr:hypothetical protein BBP40_006680 [Aspergillus hancockii]
MSLKDHADDVDDQMRIMPMSQKFKVDIDNGDTKNLSWVSLRQVAHAVQKLGANWFWLDFLCLDQVERKPSSGPVDKEKCLLICMMSDVYRYASDVVVMIGGMGAVLGVDKNMSWMDRAWTLQESILCKGSTYVYIKSPGQMDVPNPNGGLWKFIPVPLEPNLFLINIFDLLDLADAWPRPPQAPPSINVLNGNTTTPSDSPRRALRAALSVHKRIKYTGVWRSMFMQTSSHPVDVVYSIMGIFGLQIDLYRKNRDPRFVFQDLARKTAAVMKIGPSWLTLGGIWGSDIKRDRESGIVFKFPHYEDADEESDNAPPKMTFLDGSKDRRLARPSSGDIYRTFSRCTIGSMPGTIVYKSYYTGYPVVGSTQAVLVGIVGDMTDADVAMRARHNSDGYAGRRYLLFFHYVNNAWVVVADGVFNPRYGWTLAKGASRYIFTVGSSNQMPYVLNWRRCDIEIDLVGLVGESKKKWLNASLQTTFFLPAVSTMADWGREPLTIQTVTPFGINGEGNMRVALSYDGWSKSECANLLKAGVEGILIPDTAGAKIADAHYYVRLIFGEQVMYLQMRPHRKTSYEFWQMYVVPYSWGPGAFRPLLNRFYIYDPGAPAGVNVPGGNPGFWQWPNFPDIASQYQQKDVFWMQHDTNLSKQWVEFQARSRAQGIESTSRGWYEESRLRAL